MKADLVSNPGKYTAEEDEKIEEGLLLVETLSDGNHTTRLTKQPLRSRLWDVFVFYDSVRNITYGKTSRVIRGASVLDTVAFLTDYDSQFLKSTIDHPNQLEVRTLERVNNHHRVFFYLGRSPPPFRNRELVFDFIVKRLSDDQYICILTPALHKDAPVSKSVVRATSTRIYRVTKIEENVTGCELFMTIDLKGNVPSFITNSVIIPTALNLGLPLYFMHILPYSDFDKEDARSLGVLLMDATRSLSGKALHAEVQKLFHRTAVLRHLFGTYPLLSSLLHYVVENRLRQAPPALSTTPRIP